MDEASHPFLSQVVIRQRRRSECMFVGASLATRGRAFAGLSFCVDATAGLDQFPNPARLSFSCSGRYAPRVSSSGGPPVRARGSD